MCIQYFEIQRSREPGAELKPGSRFALALGGVSLPAHCRASSSSTRCLWSLLFHLCWKNWECSAYAGGSTLAGSLSSGCRLQLLGTASGLPRELPCSSFDVTNVVIHVLRQK